MVNRLVKTLLLLCMLLMQSSSAQRRHKGIDIHARAELKIDNECEHGCLNAKEEPQRCGTQEECEKFLAQVDHGEYLMYTMIGIAVAVFFSMACCLFDESSPMATGNKYQNKQKKD